MGKVYLAFVDRGHAGLKDNKANPNATPGKESPYIKSLGRKIQEEEFNYPTAKLLEAELKRAGVHVYDVAHDVYDTPLKDRVDYANKIYYQYCDKYGAANVEAIYISIHFNAFDGSFSGANPEGFSIHIYPGHKSKAAGKLAMDIVDQLKNGTRQQNRGVKENDFYVVRETVMPAALSENGFMDNPREALLMLNVSFQKEVAVEHAKGICNYFEIKYVPVPKPAATVKKGLYKVQVGAFKNKVYAEKLEKELEKVGYKDAFIKIEGGYNKVQVGAFGVKKNAEGLLSDLKKKGFSGFIRHE